MSKPTINKKKCYGCGECIETCQTDSIRIDWRSGKAVINYKTCTGCRLCVKGCPFKAIE